MFQASLRYGIQKATQIEVEATSGTTVGEQIEALLEQSQDEHVSRQIRRALADPHCTIEVKSGGSEGRRRPACPCENCCRMRPRMCRSRSASRTRAAERIGGCCDEWRAHRATPAPRAPVQAAPHAVPVTAYGARVRERSPRRDAGLPAGGKAHGDRCLRTRVPDPVHPRCQPVRVVVEGIHLDGRRQVGQDPVAAVRAELSLPRWCSSSRSAATPETD